MNETEFLVGLLGVMAVLAQPARMLNVPYSIFLVLGGIAVGLVPRLPWVKLPPEVIFQARRITEDYAKSSDSWRRWRGSSSPRNAKRSYHCATPERLAAR